MGEVATTHYVGWRRPQSGGAWQVVPGAEGPTRGAAYDALMTLSELAAGPGAWQYQILPEGQRPASDSGPSSLRYRHRAMRPGGW